MSSQNHALSRILFEMSEIYRYLGTDERFRALAYAKASRVIDGLKEDIETYIANGTLENIPGVGESIAEKITEYVRSGRVKKYEALKKKVPYELIDLMSVSGFGPQSLRQIHDELHISTRDELIAAMEDGRVAHLKGFGPRKVENMRRGLKLHKSAEERIPYRRAKGIADKVVEVMSAMEEVKQIEIAGSIRRGKETIGDIDILVSCHPRDRKKIIQRFTMLDNRKQVLARGDKKASIIVSDDHRQVDIRVVSAYEWGAALLYFTGSKEHNVYLRTLAREKGMKINEYGVYDLKTGKHLAGHTEKKIYHLFGFDFIPPEMRETSGEFDVAARHKVPELVEVSDIRGDLQMHSNWSDGNMSIAALAQYVRDHFPYQYIVLTDHSRSSRIAGGMDEKEFRKQFKEIDRVNQSIGRNYIKKGVEVDILADGSLDLSDELLSEMDWVCASIHSGFQHDNTERLLKACRHPLVHCIGHPSGRLLGKREGYPVDWKKVFRDAASSGTAFEINAQPERLDLNDQLARMAKDAGVKLTISTDSHAAEQFSLMQDGVMVARRAWCTPKDILNTGDWEALNLFARQKKKKAGTLAGVE